MYFVKLDLNRYVLADNLIVFCPVCCDVAVTCETIDKDKNFSILELPSQSPPIAKVLARSDKNQEVKMILLRST